MKRLLRTCVRHLGTSTTESPPVAPGRYFEPYSLSPAQRLFLVPLHGLRALLDPTQGAQVAAFSDAINSTPLLDRALKGHLRRLQATVQGRALLHAKPLLTSHSLPLETLLALPSGTLGHSYALFMSDHDYSADARSVVRYTTDPDLAYLSARYRQVRAALRYLMCACAGCVCYLHSPLSIHSYTLYVVQGSTVWPCCTLQLHSAHD